MATLEYKDTIGISNAKDLKRIPLGYVQAAVNVDIDDSKKIHRRRGRTVLDVTNTHSEWSNKTICLCVQGGDLKEITVNTVTMTVSFTTLLVGVGNTTMQYQTVADMVFFSNERVIGYIRNHAAHAFSNIDQTFKERMPGGHLIEYWKSRLWVFQDDKLLYSDATRPMIRDTRHNYVEFASKGKMVKAVADGLYISDSEKCMFLQGGEGDPPKWINRFDVTNSPCIEGMAVTSDGEDIIQGVIGKVIYWVTKEGVFRGLPGGQVSRVTGRNFYLDGVSKGRLMIITRTLSDDRTKVRQLLGAYDYYPGYGGIRAAIKIPAIQVDGEIAFGSSASLSSSASPSVSPSVSPSASPSISPSVSPSKSPSASPSLSPSISPSVSPSVSPSMSPSLSPSVSPSASPSVSPSISPSLSPSASPSASPSVSPSESSGSVTQANMRISVVDGTAFLDFSVANVLTDHTNMYVEVIDSVGKRIGGWIKAAGTGETLDTTIGTNTDFASDEPPGTAWTRGIGWTVVGGVGVSVASSDAIAQVVNHTVGKLFNYSVDLVSRTAGSVQFVLDLVVLILPQSVPTTYTAYRTIVNATSNFGAVGIGFSGTIDNITAKQVLTPSATGVTIVSAQGGTTYNWDRKDTGFNYNDSSGYTYIIYNPSPSQSVSPSKSPSVSPSVSPSASPSVSPSPSPSP